MMSMRREISGNFLPEFFFVNDTMSIFFPCRPLISFRESGERALNDPIIIVRFLLLKLGVDSCKLANYSLN